MGPVIKTYGSYKPKRKGLPKYVVKETLETTGNIFSALHISKLKTMKAGENAKPKKQKTTKTTAVRDFKPTFDDSLDSTFDKILRSVEPTSNYNQDTKPSIDKSSDCSFDKILKSIETTASNMRAAYLNSRNLSASTIKCLACGCVPKTSLVQHMAYECKKDSHFLNPPTRTVKNTEWKKKQVKTILKEKKKKLILQRSPAPKSLKDTPTKKPSPVFRAESRASSPKKENSFKTPKIKDPLLSVISTAVITSTPEWYARRLKFSLDTSPIAAKAASDRFSQNLASKQTEDVQSIIQPVIDMSIVKDNSLQDLHTDASSMEDEMKNCDKPEMLPNMSTESGMGSVQSCIQAQSPDEKVQGDSRIEESSIEPPRLSDHSQHVEERFLEVKINSTEGNNCAATVDDSCSLVENSVVAQSPFRPPNGYITKRRMWRKTRRTAFNLSVDMFASTNKSNCDNQSEYWSESCKADKSRVVTVRTDKSFSRKDALLVQEQFSISCDVTEKDCSVKLLKSDKSRAIEDSVGGKNSCIENASLDDSLKVSELSRELNVCLTLHSPEEVKEKLAESDADMFGELSELHSRSHNVVESKDVSFEEEESCVFSKLKEHSAKSLVSNQDISSSSSEDDSVRENSLSVSDSSQELVLKPCYVKLYRCESQTVADVLFTSQCNMDVSEDESLSLNESRESLKHTSDLQTVVQLPLSMLGKLDKITIRSSSKISQHSLGSIVNEGKLLEETLEKLKELHLEVPEAAVEEVDVDVKNMDDFKEVLSRCGQSEPLPFSSCYPESMLPKCKKIGEGAYGEVFLYNDEKQKTVIKIIPIEGDIEINAAVQKKFWEIKPEVIVAQELSSLRNSKSGANFSDVFNEVLAVRCCRGRYPQWMLDLWHAYDEANGSENDCPDVFGDDQLFIILELAHGGQDLESFEFASADQAISAITQIVFALAVGESEIRFEHRDLHWGNVLIAPSKAKATQFTLQGNKFKVPTKGVKVSVIDFTMSRMTMPSNDENMFYDFGHDEELFAAQGDYQCDIYRLMRERTRNDWSVFEPFTNVLWLHYLLDKMCSMVAYRSTSTKVHKQAMAKLENLRDAVLAFPSATAFSLSEFFKSSRVR